MSRSARLRRRRRGRGKPRNKLLLGLAVVLTTVALGALSAVGYIAGVAASAPDLSALKPVDPGQSSSVFAADGSRLGFIQASQLRTPVSEKALPETLKQATVAIEDERFFSHKGVDYPGVVRAAFKNVQSGKTIEGGSTITMQLVRNLYITRERTFERKIREAKLAEELEDVHSKRWILTKYLNSVPYGTVGGQTAIGAQAAARIYFDKPASRLALHEAALLAGLPQAPSSYNPFRSAGEAERRRDEVLDKMAELEMISPAEAQAAAERPLGVVPGRYYTARRESFFFDYVKDELIKRYGIEQVRRGGLRIKTTIDLKLQQRARGAIAGRLNQAGDPSSAIVTIDPRNGYIRAMASSSDYGKSKFNLAAQGHRQPGSTFKVMALMTALRRGVDPDATSYTSKRLKFKDPIWGPIDVATYGESYSGRISLTQATLKSDNTVYTQLALDLGPKDVAKTARDMGIRSKLEGLPAESLGGLKVGVSPLEMANAYATIASGGWRNKPIAITKVTFPDGRSRNLGKPRRTKVFEEGVTAEATSILERNMTSGTGGRGQIGCPAAGKTGTTDNFNDAWFVGFTPRLASSVWVGYPNAQIEMRSVHGISVNGGSFPAEIWGDYMKGAKRGFCGEFAKPATPARFVPFFGKYAKTGAPGATGEPGLGDEVTPGDGTGQDGQGTTPDRTPGNEPERKRGGGGDQGFDPDLYESAPQVGPGGGTSPEG